MCVPFTYRINFYIKYSASLNLSILKPGAEVLHTFIHQSPLVETFEMLSICAVEILFENDIFLRYIGF